jgi:hypothetical protein
MSVSGGRGLAILGHDRSASGFAGGGAARGALDAEESARQPVTLADADATGAGQSVMVSLAGSYPIGPSGPRAKQVDDAATGATPASVGAPIVDALFVRVADALAVGCGAFVVLVGVALAAHAPATSAALTHATPESLRTLEA